MPCMLDIVDGAAISLGEAIAELTDIGFVPSDGASVTATAGVLRRLGNNPDFLGDLIIEELARRHRDEPDENAYGPQTIMLGRAGTDCLLRANMWPSPAEPMMRSSGAATFAYGLPHDHNFDFLTVGYFGPGYWSEYYEADYDAIHGYVGEKVTLRPTGRHRLALGRIQHYRAHVDVHAQLPADALSVSLNILHTGGAQGWLDQYRFDTTAGEITAILTHGASEAFLHIAVGLGGGEAADLAQRFARTHPSDRMRLHALDALASMAGDAAARDDLWRWAERAGSRMVAVEAGARRRGLQGG